MTSSKILGFWTPSLPLSVPNPRNLPSSGQKLANPPLLTSFRYMAPALGVLEYATI